LYDGAVVGVTTATSLSNRLLIIMVEKRGGGLLVGAQNVPVKSDACVVVVVECFASFVEQSKKLHELPFHQLSKTASIRDCGVSAWSAL
jgi:hypothetical protein